MPLIDCLNKIGIPHTGIKERIDALVESGKNLIEADAIVKNEFINEEYKKANDELNSLKKELKLPKSALQTLPKTDFTEANKKYEKSVSEIKTNDTNTTGEVNKPIQYNSEANVETNKVSQQTSQTEKQTVTNDTSSTGASIEITPELKAAVEKGMPLFQKNDKGQILGFTDPATGKIYLNGEHLNPNTPIHEAGHIWTEWAKDKAANLYNRGIELINESKYIRTVRANEFYKAEAAKNLSAEEFKKYNNAKTDAEKLSIITKNKSANEYMQHEALSMAIGDKGAQFITEARKKNFADWARNLWNKIGEAAGFKNVKAEELQNMTLDEFSKRAAVDILKGGEEINAEKPTQVIDKKPPINNEGNVSAEGDGNTVGISHESLKKFAQKIGLPEPIRGEFLSTEWYADRGRKLLKAGADPNEVDNPNNELHDRISIARAHLENLVKIADEIAKNNPDGIDSDAYKKADLKATEYALNVVKKLGTLAHRAFQSLQGERNIDNDSFSAVKMALQDKIDKPASKEQQAHIKFLTDKNIELRKQAEDLQKKLIEATDKNIGETVKKKEQLKQKVDDIAKNLKDLLIPKHLRGINSKGASFEELIDGAANIVKKAIDEDSDIKIAIDDAVKHLKDSGDKSWGDFKEEDVRKKFENLVPTEKIKNNLEDLQKRFVDKYDSKFTVDEAKAIWEYAKEHYLDKGVPYVDMISNVSNDLGLTWKQVSEAITSPKTSPISDAMWKKQGDYRRNQIATKTWIENQDKTAGGRLLQKISGVFRGVAVYGHGGIFIGTHAGMTLFDIPRAKYTIKGFIDGWRFAYGNEGKYERRMEELKNSPNYIIAQRAGLKNNPERLNIEEYQNSQKYLGKIWGAHAGEKGFNAIKILRQSLFDSHFNNLTSEEKADPKAVEQVARLVNLATGATNLNIPAWVNEVSFAGGMEAARWGKLTRSPIEATSTALKAIISPSKATTADRVFAKVWAKRVGTELATFSGLLIANAALQNAINPKNPTNITNPNKPDFLKFKFGDFTIDPTSGMRSTANFLYGIGKIPFETQKELHGDSRMSAAGKSGIGYSRGKLAPFYSTVADFFTQQDFSRNPMPFSNDKPAVGKHRLTWGEYLFQKAPLPVAETISVMYKSAEERGSDKLILNDVLKGLISGGISGTTGFRVGEVKEVHTPFTDADNKDKTFKYFLDKGYELPVTSHQSEIITDQSKQTKKTISEFPENIQEKYDKIHTNELKESLQFAIQHGVFIKKYKDSRGGIKKTLTFNEPTGKFEKVSISKLDTDETVQLLRLAQSEATKKAKDAVFYNH